MITVNAQFTVMSIAGPYLAPPVWLYLLCVVLPVRFFMGPLQFTGLRLFLLLMMPFLLVRLLKSARIAPDVLLLAFAAWVYLAMQQNSPTHAVEHAGITLIELYGGYALARVYIQTQTQFQALIKLIAGLVVLCLPLAVYEALTGTPPLVQLISAMPFVGSVDVVTIAPRLNLERVQGVFAHPIHFGLFCSTAVSLVFVGLSKSVTHAARAALTVLIVITAFLALSSGAFLAVLIQLFLITWTAIFSSTRYKWWLLFGTCAVAYVCIDLLSNRTPVRVFFSYATFSPHNAYWRGLIFEWGMINIWRNPIYGLGFRDWVRPHFMHSGSMDNFWLVNAVRYGLPGFALIVTAWAVGLLRVARGKNGPQKTAWLFCMIGLTFTLCTVHVWTAVYSFVFFLFGAGQFLAKARPTKVTSSKPIIGVTRPLQLGFRRAAP